MVRRLNDAGVAFMPATWVREIGVRDVHIFNVFGERPSVIASVDAVVLVTGRLPADSLAARA